MILAGGTLVLVADGAKMLLLRNEGDANRPDLKVLVHRTIDNPPNRDQISDAPGVTFSSGGPGHSTYDQGDPHQAREDAFAQEAAAVLAEKAEQGDDRILIIAPPRSLGAMRSHYSAAVKSRLIAEVDKDLTKHPVEHIAELITALKD